jgi:molecular chaperone HtpG
MSAQVETHRFEAEVSQVLKLVINSLYSNPEVFLRELVSNAADALDKRRFRALTDHALAPAEGLEIRVSGDSEAHTVTLADSGIGMTRDELQKNLGTIAHSGSRAFLEALEQAQRGDVKLIGQFGVGFYSAFLVADRVDVVSRAAGHADAWRWSSTGEGGYTLEPAARDSAGTSITLHLREDRHNYADNWKLRELVRRYSDFIPYPIHVQETEWDRAEEGKEPASRLVWKQANRATALWQRSPSDVQAEEYDDLYRHLTHDFQPAAGHLHFRVEGTRLFDGVLFAPSKAPFDLYALEQRGGLRLYVKRVFIMDDVRELLPTFLRFLRGVVDSDDLPLNVSREILQDSKDIQFIRKHITRKALELFERLAREDAEKYTTFWSVFGPVIKEGLHTAPEHREEIARLCRYRSTASGEGVVSLADYKARMPEGQKAIYYLTAESHKAAASSPHLEALTARGYEVLLMSDPIDEWAVEGLGTFDGVELKSAMGSDLGLDDARPEPEETPDEPVLQRFKAVLGDRVGAVRYSQRLTSSPVCLAVPDGGMSAHLERLLRAQQPGMPTAKRIFELNREHPVIRDIAAIVARRPEAPDIEAWIEILHTQALLAEGGRIEDPTPFVARVTRLLEGAAAAAAASA